MYRSFLFAALLFLVSLDRIQAQTDPSKIPLARNTSQKTDAKAVPGSKETNPEAKSLYDDGIERLEMGQVSEAVERFQKALQADPDYAQAYSALGRAFFKLQQWENASVTFRRAIALKAKERERQNTVQTNATRGIDPDVAPSSPLKSSIVSPLPKLNKPLPTLPINTAVAGTRLDSALQPAQVSSAQPAFRANMKFDDLLSEPPPEVRRIAEPVPPPARRAPAILQSTIQRTPVQVMPAEPRQLAIDIGPPPPSVELKSGSAASPNSRTDHLALTTTYRVGSQDVLEIRLNNSSPQQTTVFMVTQSGLIVHPELSEPLLVSGLTAEEIRVRIEDDLKKHASIEKPEVFVGVLEYASHSVSVEGLAKIPGRKFLKSDAVPLAVVVAEAQPLREAAIVTVARNRNQILETDLNNAVKMGTLVHAGDVITLQPQISEVLYVSGKVRFPGEKRYRSGLTLMQAIITAGGATSNSGVAEIVRDGDQVERTRFDLKAIEAGKAPDPLIKPRDRIILH